MTPRDLLADPVLRLWAVTSLLLVLKMVAVGWATSALRIRRRVYATPEDYALRQVTPGVAHDEDIERIRRAHRNDLENVPPFMVASLAYALTGPGLGAARIYLLGFLVLRTLHSVFYIGGMQPWRTLAFMGAQVLTLLLVLRTLVALLG